MLTFDKEFLKSLEIEGPHSVRVGYFYKEEDEDRNVYNYISNWTPSGTGSFKYEGSLDIDEVIKALNTKAKEIYTELQVGLLQGESITEGINRMRNTYGISLQEASDFIKGTVWKDLDTCLLIKGGPLDGKCCIGSYYLSSDILDVIPLEIKVVEFPNEYVWEVMLYYCDKNYQYISIVLNSSNSEYVLTMSYKDYQVQLKSSNKESVFQGTYDECSHIESLLRTAFSKGKGFMKREVQEAMNSFTY